MVINFYADPGHGWAKVRKSLLNELGIANKITPYSYMLGDWVYLEEDCDYGTLHNALKSRGVDVKLRYHSCDNNSAIRRFPHYRVDGYTGI